MKFDPNKDTYTADELMDTDFPVDYCGERCDRCGGRTTHYRRKENKNGIFQLAVMCYVCNRYAIKNRPFVSLDTLTSTELDNIPIIAAKRKSHCEVIGCLNTDSELHHWMPHFIAGNDYHVWPRSWLCREHHKLWHLTVTPHMRGENDEKKKAQEDYNRKKTCHL